MAKKYVLSPALIVLFLLSTVCCSCGNGLSANEAAEMVVAKRFPNQDQGGYYRFKYENIILTSEEAVKFIKDHNMKVTWQNYTWAKYNGSGFIMNLDKWDEKEGMLIKIKLMKTYFTGIKKTWVDQRKGCSNKAYATYTTKIAPYRRNAELFKDIGKAKLFNADSGEYVYKTIGRHIANTIRQTSSVSKETFRKDSEGYWN